MCGIAGFLDCKAATSSARLRSIGESMSHALRHRGPDDGNVWTDESAGIVLAHRRLSIVDLSPLGRQPMFSNCQRYVLTFNGEIYNHRSLRENLRQTGSVFVGSSDTEVMLEAIRRWGLKPALKSFNGMFAFALWDRLERRLVLARDRLGEKPLYYGWAGDRFLFASELKALRTLADFDTRLDRQAIAAYLRFNYIPAPFTIYKSVRKLPCATAMEICVQRPGTVTLDGYWSAAEALERGQRSPFSGSEDEAVTELEGMLTQAVGLRMQADVPLGAFLSGGVDSSAIVALMQQQVSTPVKTFTVGFPDGVSEAQHAEQVAQHLGTDHHTVDVSWREALDVIPRLPTIYDEPFADSSQIPTFLISEFARRHVTVCLSGDGGDELFGGYNRYVWANNLHRSVSVLPGFIRKGMSYGISRGGSSALERLATFASSLSPSGVRPQNSSGLIGRMADFLNDSSAEAAYLSVTSRWTDAPEVVLDSGFDYQLPLVGSTDSLARSLMFLDTVTYLPDDILVKVDRASMAVGLEARVPLLDHRIFEFSCQLPVLMDWKGRRRKHYLRRVLSRHVPEKLFERPKSGFSAPIRNWLLGPLRPWAEEFLSESALRSHGLLNPAPIRRKWREMLAGHGNWQHHLWSVIMLQAWLEQAGEISPIDMSATTGTIGPDLMVSSKI